MARPIVYLGLILIIHHAISTPLTKESSDSGGFSRRNRDNSADLDQQGRSRGHGSHFERLQVHRTMQKNYVVSTKKPQKTRQGLYHLISSYLGISKIIGKLKDSLFLELNCDSCKLAVSAVRFFKSTNKSDDEILQTFAQLCETFGVQSRRVCQGIMPAFRDEFKYLLKNLELNSDDICGFIVGPHCSVVPSKLHTWTIHIPERTKKLQDNPPPSIIGDDVLKVLHLSDTHFDPYYVEGSNADCGEPLCCREGYDDNIPLKNRAGRWGDYRSCDTPERTLRNMLEYIQQNHKIDYILWTGDLPPHDVWNQTRSTQIFHLYKMTEIMLQYFPDTPIFPALGNHESSPVDSFPPPYIKGEISIDWLYTQLNHTWTHWLGKSASTTINKGAYYSVLVYPGFRIISINSNYCNNLNWWLLVNSTDPAQELQWLVFELQKAEQIGEKVHIIGHIPPGNLGCHSTWSQNYYKIIRRYQDTITGQFFGHNHVDEFQIFYDKLPFGNRKAINVAYVGPSTTPFKFLNPGYRIYTVDNGKKNNTWKVLDHETYYLNITAANLYNSPIWIKEYSARKDYEMESLEPDQWDKVVLRFKKDETLFNKYFSYYSRKSDNYPPCDTHCRWTLICDMQKAASNDPTFC